MITGAPLIAGWIANLVFWTLVVVGRDDLGVKRLVFFAASWVVGYFLLRDVLEGVLFTPLVAVLDIALVFIVFKGDLPLR